MIVLPSLSRLHCQVKGHVMARTILKVENTGMALFRVTAERYDCMRCDHGYVKTYPGSKSSSQAPSQSGSQPAQSSQSRRKKSEADMQMYESRPVRVQAIRFNGANWEEVVAFCGRVHDHNPHSVRSDEPAFGPSRHLEGAVDRAVIAQVYDYLHDTWVGVKPGQWIIRGMKNEFYPCDNEVFRAKYVLALDDRAERLHETDDALEWADVFVDHVRANPMLALDVGAMTGWFANAMRATERRIEDDLGKVLVNTRDGSTQYDSTQYDSAQYVDPDDPALLMNVLRDYGLRQQEDGVTEETTIPQQESAS